MSHDDPRGFALVNHCSLDDSFRHFEGRPPLNLFARQLSCLSRSSTAKWPVEVEATQQLPKASSLWRQLQFDEFICFVTIPNPTIGFFFKQKYRTTYLGPCIMARPWQNPRLWTQRFHPPQRQQTLSLPFATLSGTLPLSRFIGPNRCCSAGFPESRLGGALLQADDHDESMGHRLRHQGVDGLLDHLQCDEAPGVEKGGPARSPRHRKCGCVDGRASDTENAVLISLTHQIWR